MQPPQSPPQQTYAVPVPVFVGAALTVALVIICGLGAVGAIPSIRGLKSPTVTPTPPQPVVHSATLGGTLGDFARRYGTSMDASGLVYAATLAGQRALIIVTLDDPRLSRGGQPRVIALDVQVPGDAPGIESWDAATADTIARMFLPADAQYQRTVTTQGVAANVYHSDALAATFLPGQYTNVPGSLTYYCLAWPPTPSANGYSQCHIALGMGATPRLAPPRAYPAS